MRSLMMRPGNNPKRRIAPAELLGKEARADLAERAKYVGSGHHKRYPADYGLERTNPRPTKSLCDLVKTVKLAEAGALMRKGLMCGMISDVRLGEFPKYVWSVDEDGEVYEAKTDPMTPGVYHGYRLEEEDDMRRLVESVWKKRWPAV
ncbi:hypothetical protein [Rhodoplanes azumiensis]|uniref:Uncharacterized protein n=1 Tax=Rhodoplanes azumiensis TaxID=1897628 RepID=A0ABW5AJE3_9BRAD